jgi:TM2 domain-containing membrane protein YozV
LNAFVGFLGIDMFYINRPILGILKLFTAVGFSVWTAVNWFLIGGMTRDLNIAIAREIKATMQPAS